MIIATGQLGNAIVKKLLKYMPANQIVACTRNPTNASDLIALGVSVRQADYEDPQSSRKAFEGITQVLMISSNARTYGGDPIAQHRTTIEAAKAVGVKRIVYTSQMAASATSAFPPMLDHAKTEIMLANSGMQWTALRNGFYGLSGIAIINRALESGLLETTQDGKIAWAAHDDLAEAAAIILANEGKFEGPTPPLTGSQALDFGELMQIAANLQNKTMERKVISEDQLREKMSGFGAPTPVINVTLGLYKAAKDNEFSKIDPMLEQLIGRAPIKMRELMVQQSIVG